MRGASDMKMPWPVRIALGWFVLLVIFSSMTLLSLQGMWIHIGELGLCWMLRTQVACIGYVALGVGFVVAILYGRRKWVRIPYLLIGLMIAILLSASGPFPPLPGMPNNCFAALLWGVTAIPIALLHLPSANRWFSAFPRRERLGVGCCALVVLAIVGMMACIGDVTAESTRKNDAALMSVTAMRGRNVFRLLMKNEVMREDGASGVDVATCTNSCELVEELCACFENETGLAAWGKEWSFAVNVPPDAPDTFPVMITANVDPAELPSEWDGETDKDKLLELKPLEGVEPLRFGNRAIVVVRKGGASQVVKRKSMTLGTIFGDKPFKFGKDTYFLTPVGRR